MDVTGVSGGCGMTRQARSAEVQGNGFGEAMSTVLENAGKAVAAGSVVQLESVGGSRWLESHAASLFDGSREIIDTCNGLPVVANTPEEEAAAEEYVLASVAARGEDVSTPTFLKARLPVYDGSAGPLVGYYETSALLLDTKDLTQYIVDRPDSLS